MDEATRATAYSDLLSALLALRADPATAAIPCVALSADVMSEDIRSALAAGFDEYWTKPIKVALFLDALARIFPLRADERD